MGAVASWLLQCLYPEDQVIWQAARAGDAYTMRSALARLTPGTRCYIEWQEPLTGRTALAAAAATGSRECARLLLNAGADANATDYKGNAPLHLACKHGQPALVQLLLETPRAFPFATNLCMKTPLDVARHRFVKEDEAPRAYQECIELLEKRFCLYSGWLYEKTDNVLSYVSGISSLNSWARRFCIVLERGTPELLELALFNMRPSSGKRPVCPSTVVLYQVAAGMTPAEDTKWFNRKEHTFVLQAIVKDTKAHCEVPMVMQPLEFAAVDEEGLSAWRSFFEYHQQQLVMFRPGDRQRVPTHVQPHGLGPRAPSAAAVAGTFQSTEEDEDLRRAIRLSLQTAPPFAAAAAAAVSAPDWEDVADLFPPSPAKPQTSDSVFATAEAASEAADATRSPPVVNFAQAPSYSSIGECVICFDGPQAAVCVPCGHNAICMACAEEILETSCECPVCRQPIRELIKLYRV